MAALWVQPREGASSRTNMKRVSAVTNRMPPRQSGRPVAERDSRIRVAPDVISRPTAMPTPAMVP